MRRAVLTLLALGLAAPSGCIYASAGVETFEVRTEPVAIPAADADEPPPSPTEIAYARTTARAVFRRRASERSADFVAADPREGYALCLRSGRDVALLVFERRVFDAAISQAADDARILRGRSETAVCRAALRWVPA